MVCSIFLSRQAESRSVINHCTSKALNICYITNWLLWDRTVATGTYLVCCVYSKCSWSSPNYPRKCASLLQFNPHEGLNRGSFGWGPMLK